MQLPFLYSSRASSGGIEIFEISSAIFGLKTSTVSRQQTARLSTESRNERLIKSLRGSVLPWDIKGVRDLSNFKNSSLVLSPISDFRFISVLLIFNSRNLMVDDVNIST
jgi:hypothetical protein